MTTETITSATSTALRAVDPAEPTYRLPRDAKESARLNSQHRAYTNVLGFLLHPSIPTTAASLHVADIATGTGIWLLDVADTLAPTSAFAGFDLSPAQFPAAAATPPNMRFHAHDILTPFAPAHRGAYDIVHVRLLSIVLVGAEWEAATRNLLTLLKPGGYLQWVDSDFSQASSRLLTTGPAPHLSRGIAALYAYMERAKRPCNDAKRLWSIFQAEEELEAVEGLLATSERDARSKEEFTRSSIPVFKLALVQMGMGEAEAEEVERGMIREAEGGANYVTVNVYVAVGRKKAGV